MAHELAEKTSGLASRVNNLAVLETGDTSRTFLEEQERLTKLAMALIVKDMNSEDAAYKRALDGVNDAINNIGEADKKLGNTAKVIDLVAKAGDLIEKALKAVA
jgi:uncharacterized protein YukE